MDPTTVLFIGASRGGLRAAARLGLRALVVDSAQPSPHDAARAARWIVVDLEGVPEHVLGAARMACDGERPSAVLGFTERTVVFAAMLRRDLGLPGLSPETAAALQDKALMKEHIRAAGLPCADWRTLDEHTRAEDLVEALGLPLVIKRRAASGSRGTSLARSLDEVRAGLQAGWGPGWMAESYVRGVEMSVESLVAGGRILFRNPTEYVEPLWCNLVPAELPDEERTAVDRLNAAAIAALRVERGMTHLELFRTPAGPVFGEVAARPPGGYIMNLIWKSYGFNPWKALLRIELGDRPRPPSRPKRAAAVRVLHPGPGVVRRIRGREDARAVPGVHSAICRLAAGQQTGPRIRAGQDAGRILAVGNSRDEVVGTLARAVGLLRIEMQGPESGGAAPGGPAGPPANDPVY